VSPQFFLLVVAVGAAAIALWVDARLQSWTPQRLTWTIVHLGGAMAALQVMPRLVALVVGGTEDPSRQVAATVLVLIPVLTYCWLSALWLLKLVQRGSQLRL
jgi:hypothetical protein